jgi:hypothetical protein
LAAVALGGGLRFRPATPAPNFDKMSVKFDFAALQRRLAEAPQHPRFAFLVPVDLVVGLAEGRTPPLRPDTFPTQELAAVLLHTEEGWGMVLASTDRQRAAAFAVLRLLVLVFPVSPPSVLCC